MERLLITGVDGVLGSNLALKLSDRTEVLGLYGRQAVSCPLLRTAHCDLSQPAAVAAIVEQFQPQWILHCGPLAVASWDPEPETVDAEREPQIVTQLARIAAQHSARLTVMSSDIVFAGPRMFHEEHWPAASPSPRAAAVRRIERALEPTAALVVRTHAYGWSPLPATACYAQQTHEAMTERMSVLADGRRHATPILATDLAELLWRAFEMRLHGLYHLAGAERTSSFRFASELAAAFGFDPPRGTTPGAHAPAMAWHDETSLNSLRARRTLEMATPLLREGLSRFAEQHLEGWHEQWQAGDEAICAHEIAA